MLKRTQRTSFALMAAAMFFVVRQSVSAQIAPGEQQSAAQTATITGTVTQSAGAPVTGADVRLTGPAMLVTKSDVHGLFVFTSVPFGTYRIDVTAETLGTTSRANIIVKGDTTVAVQYVPQTVGSLKEIAHVSTHSAGASINVTPASIASISPSDYAFAGNTSWNQLLSGIPGVTVNGGIFEGNSTPTVSPESPFRPAVISINGAPPYETSVTLDGMPLQNCTFGSSPGNGPDLSVLSMSAFETADVVRGPGADAPSLVDSIGGSLVLHPAGHVERNQFEFSISNDPFGGTVSNAKAALHLGKLSATIAYSVNDSPGPFGAQNVIVADSFPPLTVNGQAFAGCSAPGCYSFAKVGSGIGFQDALLYCCRPLDTSWTQHIGAVSLLYDVAPSVTAQVFYAGSSAHANENLGLLPTDFTPGTGYSGSISPGIYSFVESIGAIPEVSSSSLLEEKITAYIGRGVLRLAALQNNSFTTQDGTPYLYPSSGNYTLYGTGYYASAPSTPVNFNGTMAYLTFPQLSRVDDFYSNNRDYLASYGAQFGSSSSAGISYVTSYYNAPFWIQGVGGPASRPSAVAETTRELRLHVSSQLSERLSLDASWYFAQGVYHVQNPNDLTGNTYVDVVFPYNSPHFGAVWQANPDIAVRAAVGGGYALPVLAALDSTNSIPANDGSYYSECLTNINLKPERAFGVDIGTDIRLHRSTIISFDLYRTNLDGQFYESTTQVGTYAGLPLYAYQQNNLGQSRYEGININVHHDVPKGMYWQASLGLMRAYTMSLPAGFYNAAGTTCNFSTNTGCTDTYIVPGINFNGYFQAAVPYANGSAQIGYRWAPEKYVDLLSTYYGNNNSYYQPAFLEFDAHAGYPLTKNIALLATFRNITGRYDQSYQAWVPSLGAPTVTGPPGTLNGIPYGPRTVIFTLNFKN